MLSRVVRSLVVPVVSLAAEVLGTALLNVKRATGLLRPLEARPLTSYGTPTAVSVKGRVRERTGVAAAAPDDPPWRNLVATVRRFTATALPGATVRLELGDTTTEVTSDGDGYFRAVLHPDAPLPAGWHDVTAHLLHPDPGGALHPPVTGRALVPPPDAEIGVISDLDDTVLRSHLTDRWSAITTFLFTNATTRAPFPGVAGLYRALKAGPAGEAHNPVFYVSASSWNTHDLVTEFLELQHVPAGPLLLRAWGLDVDVDATRPGLGHKAGVIHDLLDTYPHLSFVLIGDSGQRDPEIYRDLVRGRPGRIRAVYIRDVTHDVRHAEVQAIAAVLTAAGTPFVLVPDTAAAAAHAAGLGLVAG